MALFHFNVDQVKRSEGSSVVASAAYRAGEKLYSEYDGEISDYTRKGGVLYSEIMLPTHVPPEYQDRQTLWNAVEKIEKNRDAQLAYSFEVALQYELTFEENKEVAREFLQKFIVGKGMVVDMAIHDPDKEEGNPNPHFHFLCPIRPIEENGKWGYKQHRVYSLDENGERIRDEKGKYVYTSEATTDWGEPETLDMWREQWANLVNAKFEEKGLECRIDNRSYEKQGVDLIPTVHEGVAVRQMEAKGIKTEKGEWNRWIKNTNRLIAQISKTLRSLTEWYSEIKTELENRKEPDLSALVNAYYDERNRVAATYKHGTQKAKIGNLKKRTELFSYMIEQGITDIDKLGEVIVKKNAEAEKVQKKKDKADAFVKDLEGKISAAHDYVELKGINDKCNSIWFKGSKEKYKQEHEAELKKFYRARRLVGEFPSTGDLDELVKTWKAGLASGKKQYDEINEEYKPLKKDADMLAEVRKAVNFGLEQRNGGTSDTKLEQKIAEIESSKGISRYVQKAQEQRQTEKKSSEKNRKQNMEL